VDGLNVIEREIKVKKLLLCCMMLISFGCAIPNDMLATAVTIHNPKTFAATGSGTIIDISPLTEDLNMVTILTALHVAQTFPTPLIRVRIYDSQGNRIGAVVSQGFIYSGYASQDIATIWFSVNKKVPLKATTIAKNHKFRVGEKLWLTSSPGGSYPLLSDGIFGGWCQSSVFFLRPGGYYTGGVSPGSSGGGIFNSRQELVGMVSRVLSTPYPIGSNDHRHIIPILHPQGGVFIPFTSKKIDGLFLEKIKMTEERKKNAS